MVRNIHKGSILQCFLIYMCFLNTSSKAASMFDSGFIVFTLVVCVACFFVWNIKILKRYAYFMLILFVWILLQHYVIQGNISIVSTLNLMSKFLIAYCAVKADVDHYFERFVRVTIVMAICSLVFFLLSQTPAANLMTYVFIPNHALSWTGNISYGRFLYHYMPGYTRNVGIYSEPGVFQLFLNLCLFCVLFMQEYCKISEKKARVYTLILLFTIITTMSTAGYITTLIILAGYIIKVRKQLSVRNMAILLIIIVSLAVFSQTEIFYESFLKKLQFSASGTFKAGTGNARLASILLDLKYIANNVWGNGYSGSWINTSTIAQSEVGSSVGLTSMVNVYGIPIAIIIYGSYLWAFRKTAKEPLGFLVLLLTFISGFLSQPWILTPVYLTILSYGFCANHIRSDVMDNYKGDLSNEVYPQ